MMGVVRLFGGDPEDEDAMVGALMVYDLMRLHRQKLTGKKG